MSSVKYESTGENSSLTGNRYAGTIDEFTRPGFIRKVYGIVLFMLTISCGVMTPFCLDPYETDPSKGIGPYLRDATNPARNPAVFWSVFVVSFACIIAFSCCRSTLEKVPLNYCIVVIFSLAEGVLLGMIASAYQPDSVLMAAGMTVFVVFALTLFAFQTKYDFTGMGPYLFVALIVLILFGFVASIFGGPILRKVYAAAGCLIFSMYLVFDTQLIVGCSPTGKPHQFAFTPDDYIMAALQIYLDIINLFILILSLLGDRK